MDAHRFDAIARALIRPASRRRSLTGLLAGVLAAALPGDDLEAGGRGPRKRHDNRTDQRLRNEGKKGKGKKKKRKNKKKNTDDHGGDTPPTDDAALLTCKPGFFQCPGHRPGTCCPDHLPRCGPASPTIRHLCCPADREPCDGADPPCCDPGEHCCPASLNNSVGCCPEGYQCTRGRADTNPEGGCCLGLPCERDEDCPNLPPLDIVQRCNEVGCCVPRCDDILVACGDECCAQGSECAQPSAAARAARGTAAAGERICCPTEKICGVRVCCSGEEICQSIECCLPLGGRTCRAGFTDCCNAHLCQDGKCCLPEYGNCTDDTVCCGDLTCMGGHCCDVGDEPCGIDLCCGPGSKCCPNGKCCASSFQCDARFCP